MRSHRSLLAFVLAVGFHALSLSLFLPFIESDNDPVSKPTKRFGLRLSEEPTLSEAVEPVIPSESSPEIPSAITAENTASPPPPKPDKEASVAANVPAVPEQQLYTQADVDALPRSVIHHYGERFFELSAGEQRYIIDNLQRIRKINEVVGTRILRERPDEEIDPDDSNIVEFTLYPDGTISDLHLQRNRVGSFLDELTLQTINLAHPKYPRPAQPTLIRIRVYIVVK